MSLLGLLELEAIIVMEGVRGVMDISEERLHQRRRMSFKAGRNKYFGARIVQWVCRGSPACSFGQEIKAVCV